jgi:hypothetical protein
LKNVLLLAFYFPPRNHIASHRSGCFAKFLPENGWLPTVVCDDWPSDRPDYEPDFGGSIPKEVEVHRVTSPPLAGFYERFVLRKIGPYLWPQRAPIRWWENARSRVFSLMRSKRFDAIWATSDPLVPWGLAEEAARLADVPWIADMRDSFNEQPHGSWYKRPFFARQERRLASRATRVVAVTQGMADRFGRLIGRKIDVIYNGFDPTLLPENPLPRSNLFTITYAGTLSLPRYNPAPFLQAVECCLQHKTIPADDLEIQFYGSGGQVIEQVFPRASERLRLKIVPRVPNREILRLLPGSSVLLMLDDVSAPDVLPGKTGDYLSSGRPILCYSNRLGELSDVLRRTGTGVTLTRVEDMAAQLGLWYAQWKSANIQTGIRNEAEIERFSRRFGAKQLAGLLDEISNRH